MMNAQKMIILPFQAFTNILLLDFFIIFMKGSIKFISLINITI